MAEVIWQKAESIICILQVAAYDWRFSSTLQQLRVFAGIRPPELPLTWGRTRAEQFSLEQTCYTLPVLLDFNADFVFTAVHGFKV